MELLFLLIIFVLFLAPTIMMSRKQRQAQQQIADLQASLSVGDTVVTAAGIHGVVVGLDESVVDLDVADNTVITMDRTAVLRTVTEPAEVTAVSAESVDANEPAAATASSAADESEPVAAPETEEPSK